MAKPGFGRRDGAGAWTHVRGWPHRPAAGADDTVAGGSVAAGVAVEQRNGSATTSTDQRLYVLRHNASDRSTSEVDIREDEVGTGVGLSRLIEITRLTPAQALTIGLDAVSALESRHATGTARGGFGLEAVRVDAGGRTRLTGPASAGEGESCRPGERCRCDLAAVTTLLTALARAARRGPVPEQGAADPLTALDRAADQAARPDGEIAVVAALLRHGDAGSPRVRAELAGLVGAAGGHRSSAPPTPAAPAVPPRPPGTPAAPDRARTATKRSWKWALSFLVLVATILIEFAFLHDQISRDLGLVLRAGRSGSAAAPAPGAPPVPAPAPPAAGVVAAVDLRALRPCSAGTACEVRLFVRLHPHPQPQTVGWTFQVLDRCSGAAVTAPGGTLTVRPGGDAVAAVDTVPLPPGRALAVTAVTSRPASAASTPLLVPAAGSCNPGPGGAPA